MMYLRFLRSAALGTGVLLLTVSCAKRGHDHDPAAHKPGAHSSHGHEHHAPHGGTPVILGDEAYHLEFVHDALRDVLQAFVLDGHMENFIRCAAPSFEVIATAGGEKRRLIFLPVTDAATGERPGDASLFEASAPWLKTTPAFEGVLTTLTVRGSTYGDIGFRFPQSAGHKH